MLISLRIEKNSVPIGQSRTGKVENSKKKVVMVMVTHYMLRMHEKNRPFLEFFFSDCDCL